MSLGSLATKSTQAIGIAVVLLGSLSLRSHATLFPFGMWKSGSAGLSATACRTAVAVHPWAEGGNADKLQGSRCITDSTSDYFAASSCSIYVYNAGGVLGCAIYSDYMGSPGELLCSSVTQGAVANSWNTVALSNCPSLTKDTHYWIVWNNNNASIQYGEGSPGSACSSANGTERYINSAFGTWPSLFESPSDYTCAFHTQINLVAGTNFSSAPVPIDPEMGDTPLGFSDDYNDGQIGADVPNVGARFTSSGESWPGNAWVGEDGAPPQRYFGYFRYLIPTTIPAGATVTHAILELYGNGTLNWNSSSDALRIWMQKLPSTPQPHDQSYYPGDVAGTVLTTASVRWPLAGGLSWSGGVYNESPDFSSVVQELVDSFGGLRAGDYLTIWVGKDNLLGDTRGVGFKDSTDTTTSRPPKFTLRFSPASGVGAPTKLKLSGPTSLFTGYCSESPYRVTALDVNNKTANVTANVQVDLTSSGGGGFYSDSNCQNAVTFVTLATGTSSQVFYFKNSASETINLTATDHDSVLTVSTLSSVVSAIRPFTWIGGGGADTLWTTGANWSGGIAPAWGDVAYFDSNCIPNCDAIVNTDPTLSQLSLVNAYAGTLSFEAGRTLYAGWYPNGIGIIQESGNFVGGSGAIDVRGKFILKGGSFTASSGVTTTMSAVTILGGTLNHNSGTWIMDTQWADHDFGGATLNNLVSSGWSNYLVGNVTLDGNLDVNTGGGLYGGGTINLNGDLTLTAGGDPGDITVRLIGSGAQTWSGDFPIHNIEIASSGTVTVSGDVQVTGDFTYTSGTVVTTGSTVRFWNYSDEPTQTITPGTMHFDHVNLNHVPTIAIAPAATAEMNIDGNLTLDMQYGNLYGGTLLLGGNLVVVDAGWGDGDTALTFNGTGTQNIIHAPGGGVFSSGAIIVDKPSGAVVSGGTISFHANQVVRINLGIWDLNGQILSGGPDFSVSIGGFLKLKGNESLSFNSFTPEIGSTVQYYGTSDYSSYNLNGLATFDNLLFDGVGGTWQHTSGTTTVNGNLTILNGTFQAENGSSALHVGGNWNNQGTYTPAMNLVKLVGTNQSIGGATTFYDLEKNVTSADTLTFNSGVTQTILNMLTLKGASGQLLFLRRNSVPVIQWNIDPQGSHDIGYVDVQDSNNINAAPLSGGGTSVNSGNNTNWTLP